MLRCQAVQGREAASLSLEQETSVGPSFRIYADGKELLLEADAAEPARFAEIGERSLASAVQGFVAAENDAACVVLSSREALLAQLGGLNLGRFEKVAKIERPHVYSWLLNNYWTTNFRASAEGELRFQCCSDCSTLIHPPAPVCPACLSRDSGVKTVSGRATVHTWTINHQPWIPGFDPPYVVAVVEIEEQPDVRLMTNMASGTAAKAR